MRLTGVCGRLGRLVTEEDDLANAMGGEDNFLPSFLLSQAPPNIPHTYSYDDEEEDG